MHWAALRAAAEVEDALLATLDNLPSRPMAWLVRRVAFPLGRSQRRPSDALESRIARAVHESLDLRSRLTRHMHLPEVDQAGLGQLDRCFTLLHRAAGIQKRVKAAVQAGQLPKLGAEHLVDAAAAQGLITPVERDTVAEARAMQRDLVQVDAFTPPSYLARCGA